MRWTAPIVGVLVALSACATAEPPTAWSLVGVYDASALTHSGIAAKGEDALGAGAQYVWVAPAGMRRSCGPAKAADGLGVFEAEAMANRLTPTLAILLERNGDDVAPMTPDDVRVSIGMPDAESGVMEPVYQLQPAVTPRYVSVRIDGDADPRHKQVVRNQLRMELCMEHKTGRGWIGGDRTQLREAFLLDPPKGSSDRKFFGGQRDPVPALLGPSDACFQQALEEPEEKGQDAGRGDGSLSLVPSDVWGASLRLCAATETGGADYRGMRPIPLTIGATTEPPNRTESFEWGDLVATLHDGETELDIKVDLLWRGEALMQDAPLLNQPVDEDGNPTGPPGVTDLLQKVPHNYPLVGTTKDPKRYTLLLIPAWQVVEGLRRIDQAQPKDPRVSAGDGIQDGVGWLIDNPEHLFVQLPPRPGLEIGGADGDGEIWLNVAEPLAGGRLGLMRWGYAPGMLSGRAPVVLPGVDQPTWEQVKASHNAELHASFLGAFVLLLSLGLLGLQRVGDLWANIPEERVDFWPSPDGGAPEEDEEVPDAPKLPEGG